MAYKASTKQDLLDGMDEFIDDLTVLPPSIWDPSNRLEPPQDAISMVNRPALGLIYVAGVKTSVASSLKNYH